MAGKATHQTMNNSGTNAGDPRTVGIFDSGLGGLSVLQHIRRLMPEEDLLYAADQARVPYGSRPTGEIGRFSQEITRFLLDREAKLIVVACNTASAAALSDLRTTFPDTPFVGMEPAVKPGAGQSKNGRIGVLATAGTFGSSRYARLMALYAQGVAIYEDPCPGLVEQIEAGQVDSPETERILSDALKPMLAGGVDTLVLGCTHYPFVIPVIRRLAGPDVAIIDPAPAVARQVERVLSSMGLLARRDRPGSLAAFTSGDPARLAAAIGQLLGPEFTAGLHVTPRQFDLVNPASNE